MTYTKEELDSIIRFGTIHKAPTHGFREGIRIELNHKQSYFIAGTSGEVIGIDQWGRLEIRLDYLPNLHYYFHHSHLEREGWFANNG